MSDFIVRIEDHSDDVLRELDTKIEKVLESWGQQGVSYVKNIITAEGRVDTDAMRGGIHHQVQKSERAVYVGTNIEYAYYHEFGTGLYHDKSDGKQGRIGWWVYVPGDKSHKVSKDNRTYTKEEALRIMMILRSKGLDAHITQGIKPIHMIKNGIGNNKEKFQRIAEDILKK